MRWMCGIFLLCLLGNSAQSQSAQTLKIATASSLTAVMKDLAETFAATNSHIQVQLQYGGSQQLIRQVMIGADLDGLVLASLEASDDLKKHQLIDPKRRETIATNQLVIAAQSSAANDYDLTFDQPWKNGPLKIATGHKGVPLGQYASTFLGHTSWLKSKPSPTMVFANNAKDATTYVRSGAVDLGILYETDVRHTSELKVIKRIPEQLHESIRYVAMPIKSSKQQRAYDQWSRFLKSPLAQDIWSRYGFESNIRPMTVSGEKYDDRRSF